MLFKKRASAADQSKNAKIEELKEQLAAAHKEIYSLKKKIETLSKDSPREKLRVDQNSQVEVNPVEEKRAQAAHTMGALPKAITLREELESPGAQESDTAKIHVDGNKLADEKKSTTKRVDTTKMSSSDKAKLKEERVSSKLTELAQELDSLVANISSLSGVEIATNPLQYYWLRAHPTKLDNEYLVDEFPTITVGALGAEALNGHGTEDELTAVLEGPNFSDHEQCDLAFQETVQFLVRSIAERAQREKSHPDDLPFVNCCKQLLSRMDIETLTLVLQSEALSLKSKMENMILKSFAAETAHLYTKLEEKKVYLRPKFSQATRTVYDEYGEPAAGNLVLLIIEMLKGIRVAKIYNAPFVLFSDVEDDYAPYAIVYMRAWLEDDAIEPAPKEGLEYEKWVADQLNKHGWTARVTQGSGDHGIDVVAIIDDLSVGIQCKRYSGAVGNKAVQEVFAGIKHLSLDKAVVISNSDYTKSAHDLAQATGTILVNDEEIPELHDRIIASKPC